MEPISRRQMLRTTSWLGSALAVGLPLSATTSSAASGEQPAGTHKLKVIVAGGHPGDPEYGCGGTIAHYTERGDDVALLYLNRGEGGIVGKTADQAGAIRTAEANKACELLKARPLFAGQLTAIPS